MLRIGQLEDEQLQIDTMHAFLEQYRQSVPSFSYKLTLFNTGEELLKADTKDFDILFMDIQLPDMLGIDAARRIRESDPEIMIVFVTNYTQYAIDGYSVNAYDYLLKPLLYDAFKVKMDRFINILTQKRNDEQLVLKTKQNVYHVKVRDIYYIEVVGHTLVFHTKDKEIRLWGTLSEYEKKLKPIGFSRCNACYLVNLKYVGVITGSGVIVAHDELSISKTKRRDFLSDLARFKGGAANV